MTKFFFLFGFLLFIVVPCFFFARGAMWKFLSPFHAGGGGTLEMVPFSVQKPPLSVSFTYYSLHIVPFRKKKEVICIVYSTYVPNFTILLLSLINYCC